MPGRPKKNISEKAHYRSYVNYTAKQKEELEMLLSKTGRKSLSDLFKQAVFHKKLKVEYVEISIEKSLVKISIFNEEMKKMLNQSEALLNSLKSMEMDILDKQELINKVQFNCDQMILLKSEVEEEIQQLFQAFRQAIKRKQEGQQD